MTRSRKAPHRVIAGLGSALLLASGSTSPGATGTNATVTAELMNLPLESLLEIEVTTSARHAEKLSQSAAAISVLTAEDIERAGVTTLPEALRLAPGLSVARLDASQWAVSSRGFNDVFANKLLVLQDGRSVYTPLFSGVFWDVQTPLFGDIDRIEVIRGPGATLWGANAVNGVVNVISKNARETQGGLIVVGGGSEDRGFGAGRYGGQISEDAYYRIYGNYYNRDDSALPDGGAARDAWQIAHGGFRVDWDFVPNRDKLMFEGDLYYGQIHQVFGTFVPGGFPTFSGIEADTITVDGGNLLGRWTHSTGLDSDLNLQVYYDRTERNTAIFSEQRDSFDVDLQHRFMAGERNQFIWGAGYRLTSDRIGNTPTIELDPSSRSLTLLSAFLQDEITLIPDRLRLTGGTKLEHNDFTGFEVQPSGRLLWTPHSQHTVWGSVSRAVRTPSRAEDDLLLHQSTEVAPGFFVPTEIHGSRSFDSEELLAYEIGYRSHPLDRLSFDVAGFYNDYERLRSVEADPANPTVFHADNQLYGSTYGVEVAATLRLTDWWRLRPSYTFLQMELHRRSGSTDTISVTDEGKNPEHQFLVWSQMDLPEHLTLDCIVRYVDDLPAIGIPSYVGLDLRLGWRPKRNLEISVGAQNLLDPSHPEFSPSFIRTQAVEIQRAVYGRIRVEF